MQIRNTKQYFDEEKEIAAYLGSTGKSDDDRLNILEECWKDEDTRQLWLSAARNNNPVDDANDEKAASHNDGQQRQGFINDIKKGLIIDAQAKAHDAIKHGGIDPLVAVNDALSNAIDMAIEEGAAMARAERRK